MKKTDTHGVHITNYIIFRRILRTKAIGIIRAHLQIKIGGLFGMKNY